MYRLTKHRAQSDRFLRFAVFPIRNTNLSEIEHQFGYPALYVLVQILNCCLEKCSRYLRALRVLGASSCLDELIRTSKTEGFYPSSSRVDLKLRCTIIHDFSSRDWRVFFCILLIDGNMLSSLSPLVQPVREGRLDTGSWAVECSRQCIDGYWDIVTRFCNIHHECFWLASQFKSSKTRVPLEQSADLT
jgi:hypothetical protein